MSLTLIAIAGVLLGFLCLLVGFFMDTTDRAAEAREAASAKTHGRERRMKPIRKRVVGLRKKAA